MKTAKAGGHRDSNFGHWWIWLAVAFAVAIGIIYIVPLVFSSQLEEELGSPPTSITEVDPTTNNNSEQQSDAQSEQNANSSSITEGSQSGGAESAVPRPQ